MHREQKARTIYDRCYRPPPMGDCRGLFPKGSHGPAPSMTSHETECVLNASDQEARIEITIFYADRDPVGPYRVAIPPRRTKHVRFNDLTDPEPIPHGTDFASIIESTTPVV